jgi:hypothetical protein
MSETTNQTARSELAELRSELRQKHDWVKDDKQLWVEISVWLQAASKQPDGSVTALVQRRLQELTSKPEHKMFPHSDVDEPEDAFPEDCEGCPHYGVQCPMTARKTSADKLERIIEEAEDDDELQSRLYAFANRQNCHVIPDLLDERAKTYRKLLSWGEELRRRLVATTSDMNLEEVDIDASLLDQFDIDPEEFGMTAEDLKTTPSKNGNGIAPASVLSGGGSSASGMNADPPAEAAERIRAITDEVMGDGEDGDAEAMGGAD